MKVGDSVKIIYEGDHHGKIGKVVGQFPRAWPQKNVVHVAVPGVKRTLNFYHEDLEVQE